MYHPEYGKALHKLGEVHEQYRQSIDLKRQDVRLAIYYLTGGAITQANLAIKAWENGDLNTPFRAKRFIDESYLLIIGLIAVPDRDRFVRRFFKDDIVEIDPRKYRSQFMTATGMDDAAFDNWMDLKDTLKHGFSKGVHVTYNGVAYNSDADTGEFDYTSERLAYHPIDGFDFAHFVIIPTIDTVTAPSALFKTEKKDLEEILTLRDKIQEIALAAREERVATNKSLR